MIPAYRGPIHGKTITMKISKMSMLDKLDKIREYPTISLYQIVFRNAGVGLMFFEGLRLTEEERMLYFSSDRPVGMKDILLNKALVVYQYYPTLDKAIDEEYKRLYGKAKK